MDHFALKKSYSTAVFALSLSCSPLAFGAPPSGSGPGGDGGSDGSTPGGTSAGSNATVFQYFEWYTPDDGEHWNRLKNDAANLRDAGITAIWLPPASKGDGTSDVGYGIYDGYDLGEFDQKGTIRTKYGTKDQLLGAVNALKNNSLKVYADIILNHRMWADSTEIVSAVEVDSNDRTQEVSSPKNIEAWTVFNFSGRGGTYSTFTWNASHFDGVDWDHLEQKSAIYRFETETWDWEVDTELGNYDYLMGADINLDNTAVQDELRNWGHWLATTLDLDGVRMDAVKHIKFAGVGNWVDNLRTDTGKNLFAVGEYLDGNVAELEYYLGAVNHTMSLFDFPLHFRFSDAASANGRYDMGGLLTDTLVSRKPNYAVTFVDNHDTQRSSVVDDWFKPIAYAVTLTRAQGYPKVFLGDYYGTSDRTISSHQAIIDKLLRARTHSAYGTQHDYLDHHDVIGWTREGIVDIDKSGLATIVSDGNSGTKTMYVGTRNAGEIWVDLTGNVPDQVTIDANGYGTFSVNRKSVSVYVEQ
jgi:alpha-amylase